MSCSPFVFSVFTFINYSLCFLLVPFWNSFCSFLTVSLLILILLKPDLITCLLFWDNESFSLGTFRNLHLHNHSHIFKAESYLKLSCSIGGGRILVLRNRVPLYSQGWFWIGGLPASASYVCHHDWLYISLFSDITSRIIHSLLKLADGFLRILILLWNLWITRTGAGSPQTQQTAMLI